MRKTLDRTYQIVPRFPQGKTHAVTLSYDDGVTTDIRMVELMRAQGVKGTFNINTSRLSEEIKTHPKGQWGKLTYAQCKELYGTDMEVAVHTATHPFLERIPTAEVMQEVLEDRIAIEEMVGHPVRGMAYPYGTTSDAVVDVLRMAGIVYARTTVSTEQFSLPTDWLRMPATCHHNNPRLMELTEEFLKPVGRYGVPKLFYLWGHTYEFEQNDNWPVIEQFLAMIGKRPELWYATNIEIYDYLQAYHRLQWSVGRKMVENPSAMDVWIGLHGIGDGEPVVRIPAGEMIRLP